MIFISLLDCFRVFADASDAVTVNAPQGWGEQNLRIDSVKVGSGFRGQRLVSIWIDVSKLLSREGRPPIAL